MAPRPGGRRERDDDDQKPHASWHPAAPPRTRAELRALERAQADVTSTAEPQRRQHRPTSLRFRLLLLLSSLVLLAWAGLCFLDTGQPILVALTSLAPVLSVLALPVFAIAVAGRQVVPAVIAIGAAIVPWALVAGSAVAGPGPTSITNHQTLRVMTVDGADGDASAATIVRATRSFGVDVLVITGLSSTLAHDLTVAGISSLLTPRWVLIPPGQTSGAGLWSQLPVSDVQAIPNVSLAAETAQLSTDAGPISLVMAHAGGDTIVPDSRWRADLEAISRASPTGPRILAGELGGTPWHPAFRGLRSNGWYEAADVLGRGLRPTWPSWGPLPISPLDHVLVGGGVGVSQADTITIPGTTHRALIVTVVLPNAADKNAATTRGSGAGD